MTTKEVILPKREYDRLLKMCEGSAFTIDEFLVHNILQNVEPSKRKLIPLKVLVYDVDGKLYTTVNISALGEQESKTRDYFYKGYKITVEPYGKSIHRKTLINPGETYETNVYRYFILNGADDWEYKDNGYTGVVYALKNAKKVIDEHLENAEWLGFHDFNGYSIEISQHGIKGHKTPFFKYQIHNWENNPDDAVQYGYKKAVHALDAAENTISHYLEINGDEDDFQSILEDASAIVDYAVNGTANPVIDNPIASEDGYWEEQEESRVEYDDFWVDENDNRCGDFIE